MGLKGMEAAEAVSNGSSLNPSGKGVDKGSRGQDPCGVAAQQGAMGPNGFPMFQLCGFQRTCLELHG